MKKFLLALVFLSLLPLRAEEPAEALKVLERLNGTWKVEATFFKTEWNSQERKIIATDVSEWTLDKHFLQWKGEDSEKRTTLNLYTYDALQKCYRHWWFGSSGDSNESTGQWDATTNTFTWKGAVIGGAFTLLSTQHFLDADSFEWTLRVTDADGKIYVRIEGKSVRK